MIPSGPATMLRIYLGDADRVENVWIGHMSIPPSGRLRHVDIASNSHYQE